MSGTMSWSNFTTIPNGLRVFNHGGDECVALANLYNEEVLGNPFVPVPAAKDWWEQVSNLPQLKGKFSRNQTPAPGAIEVKKPTRDNPYGHILVVTSVNTDGSYQTIEQNMENRWVWHYTRPKNDPNRYGFLHPVRGVAPTKTHTSEPKHARKRNKMFAIFNYDNAFGKGKKGWQVVGTGFYLELSTQKAAEAWVEQLGTHSTKVDKGLWEANKLSATKGKRLVK